MKAMILNRLCAIADNKNPLVLDDMPDPVPRDTEILIKVSTCGVCHTELDEIEGRTPPPKLPVVLGHQIVGRVQTTGAAVTKHNRGERVGIAWIHSACGTCHFCRSGAENLCDHFKATGRDVNGGYAEYATVPEDFAYKIPAVFTDSITWRHHFSPNGRKSSSNVQACCSCWDRKYTASAICAGIKKNSSGLSGIFFRLLSRSITPSMTT